jgi:hypothetical protein
MKLLPLLVCAAFLAFSALAQDRPPLSDAQVRGFVKSYPELVELGQRHASDAPKRRGPGAAGRDPQSAMKARVEAMRAAGAHPEVQALVRRHGFVDFNQWIDVATRVMGVVAYSGSRGGDPAAQVARSRQQIESNPRLSPEQKRQALDQLAAAERSLAQSRPSEADRKVVEPHLPQIEAMMRPTQRPRR